MYKIGWEVERIYFMIIFIGLLCSFANALGGLLVVILGASGIFYSIIASIFGEDRPDFRLAKTPRPVEVSYGEDMSETTSNILKLKRRTLEETSRLNSCTECKVSFSKDKETCPICSTGEDR